MFLNIQNGFNPFPDPDGWTFSIRVRSKRHSGNDAHFFPARHPNSIMVGHNPDMVMSYEKRLAQKFDARFSASDTFYPNNPYGYIGY